MEIVEGVTSPVAVESVIAVVTATNNFFNATMNSLVLILATELGDKTFFIAAVLAMRNARLTVYAGAMS